MPEVRTRIAPSPTGFLHLGTARTALFNYLFARQQGGKFILRIEDTDLERSDKKYEQDIIEGLKWLGIDWDGEITRQSERTESYKKNLSKLLEKKKAFFCPHSKEELEEERNSRLANNAPLMHRCDARDKMLNKGVIRFKNDEELIVTFDDEIRGQVGLFVLDDFILAKDLQTPLYNFAVVVDDYEMGITHIIRGEDHISNTHKQRLIAKELGWWKENEKPPWKYAHLPLILGPDRSKLSKRHGAESIREYKEAGYLPEAMFNFMALLGWHPLDEREIFSKEELIAEFSLERVQRGGAIFDVKKLDWINGEYLRNKIAPNQLIELGKPYLINAFGKIVVADINKTARVIKLEQPRIKKLSELPEKVDYFYKEPEYDKELLRWKNMTDEKLKESLNLAKILVNEIPTSNFIAKELGEKFCAYKSIFPIDPRVKKVIFVEKDGRGGDFGPLLWPFRVALSGREASPGPFEIAEILGKEETIRRIRHALELLS